jgi:hypothetical protein
MLEVSQVLIAFQHFPDQQKRKILGTNLLERVNK